MSENRNPRAAPGPIIQIAPVVTGLITAQVIQVFALCADGSIWRIQEYDPNGWIPVAPAPSPAPVAAPAPPPYPNNKGARAANDELER